MRHLIVCAMLAMLLIVVAPSATQAGMFEGGSEKGDAVASPDVRVARNGRSDRRNPSAWQGTWQESFPSATSRPQYSYPAPPSVYPPTQAVSPSPRIQPAARAGIFRDGGQRPLANAVEALRRKESGGANAPRASQGGLSAEKAVSTGDPQHLLALAKSQEAQGNLTGARILYSQILTATPQSVVALRQAGRFEDRHHRLQAAEQLYRQAMMLDPKDTATLNDLGLCLARQQRYDESAEVLHQAVRLAPEKPLYRNNIATVLMELGEQREAMLHLSAVHEPAVAFYNMGNLLELRGQQQNAVTHYAQATQLDPTMQLAHSALARINNLAPLRSQTALVSSPPTGLPRTLPAPAPPRQASFAVQSPSPGMPLPETHPEEQTPAISKPRGDSQLVPRMLPPIQ